MGATVQGRLQGIKGHATSGPSKPMSGRFTTINPAGLHEGPGLPAQEACIEAALHVWKDAPAQFADCLIGALNRYCNCEATASFDTDALKLPGFVPKHASP